MSIDQFGADTHVRQAQTGERGHIRIRFGVKPCSDKVDELYLTIFSGLGLKQFFLACLNRARLKLPLDYLQAFINFILACAGTVSTE